MDTDDTMEQAIVGCLVGAAVGDAIGLPMEGIPRRRLNRLYHDLDGHRLLFGRGMVSDDTEHACMVAQSMIASAGDPDTFTRHLAREMRAWLAALPAGTGLATLKATLRLCFGVSPERSGVWSAGNGPAMRSPIIGVCCGHDLAKMRELVRASTRMTHTDPKAEYGAFAVALAAHCTASGNNSPGVYLDLVRNLLDPEGEELTGLLEAAVESAASGESTEAFADSIGWGRGISGYIYSTAPVVIQAWLRHPMDYRKAVLGAIRCGGDTDTVAAIVGGIVGAGAGRLGIPQPWIDGLLEWPRGVTWMKALAHRLAGVLADGEQKETVPFSRVALATRNALFLLVVLAHGFRRLLPPY